MGINRPSLRPMGPCRKEHLDLGFDVKQFAAQVQIGALVIGEAVFFPVLASKV